MARTPGTYNFRIYIGKLIDEVFTWKDSNGSPINLTGYSARFRLVGDANSAELLNLTSAGDGQGNGITIGGAAGTIQLTIKSAKTQTLAQQAARYELELTQPSNETIPFLIGEVDIIEGYA